MKKKLLSRLLAAVLSAAALICLAGMAFAAGETGTLSISYPVEGTFYHIYRVGSLKNGGIVMDDDFAGVDTSDMAAAAGKIAEMIAKTGIRQALASAAVTDGNAVFRDLPMAVYLLTGDPGQLDGVNYTPTPFLVSIPQTDEEGRFVWDVQVVGKKEMDMEISVVKHWVGDTATTRPASITVHLVLDGEDYGEPVKLNYANRWSYTWENLPPKNWSVREEPNRRYTTTVVKNGNTFIITNTWKRLPQTGQLWWPVSVLTISGLGLLGVGMLRRRKQDEDA